MSEDKKVMVDEKIDILFTKKETMTSQELIDKLTELYKQHATMAYEKFNVGIEDVKELNSVALVFTGSRPETKDETKVRESKEAVKRKQIEEAELKEFLRLKKKYGKSEE